MLRPRWKKIIRDLWNNKTRTLLVVLSITVGVFAFGTVAAARVNILEGLRTSFLSVNPVSATIRAERFNDDLVAVIEKMDAVAEAQGQRTVPARIEIGPDTWYDMQLIVIPDDGMRINIVRPYRGAWPPPKHALLVERASLPKTHANVGDLVTVKVPGGEKRSLPIAGLAHDMSLPPAPIAGKAFGYISFDTLEWFGGDRSYNDLMFTVAEHPLDEEHIWYVANEVADKIERSGREVDVTDVPTPQQHPAEAIIPTILLILTGLGVLTLLLGGFLIVNTVEAIITQQIRQIGMMKAIGARNQQIMMLYFVMVLAFGVPALLLALPLGSFGAYGLTYFMAKQLNFDITHFRMPPPVILLKIASALLLPVMTAIPSITSAARITVRQALDSNMGSANQAGTGWIDRIVQYIRGVPRPLLLSLRNTFRRKGRLLRTLLVLTLGGAVFISVLTVRTSLFYTLDASLDSKHYDIEVRFNRPYRSAKVMPDILRIPGVVAAESWGFTKAYPVRSDGSEGEVMSIYAPPADTKMLDLRIEEGRWLLPQDKRAIVVSSNYISKKEPGTRLGDEIVLQIEGNEYTWRVVGISQEFSPPVDPAIGYVNYEEFAYVVGRMGRVDNLQVATAQHTPAFQEDIVRHIEETVERTHVDVSLIRSSSESRAMMSERFNILTALLSIMATLIAIVGGIGLMGTMSINVIERSKEIGIMRAIGASDKAVQQIVMSEGIVIGLLAWVTGTLLSLPISRVMSMRIGYSLLNEPLLYSYAFYAVVVWLALMLIIATLASLLPARNALRITIREVLAYE